MKRALAAVGLCVAGLLGIAVFVLMFALKLGFHISLCLLPVALLLLTLKALGWL